jgi:hypothetical protein
MGALEGTSGWADRLGLLSDPPGVAALTIGTDNSSSTYSGPIADATGGPGTVNKVGTGS